MKTRAAALAGCIALCLHSAVAVGGAPVTPGAIDQAAIAALPVWHGHWVEVHAWGKAGKYARILRYRGRTGYGDGNRLAVVDSEMPAILRRLGQWQPGDAMPVPARMPKGCTRLFMRQGEEWCNYPQQTPPEPLATQ